MLCFHLLLLFPAARLTCSSKQCKNNWQELCVQLRSAGRYCEKKKTIASRKEMPDAKQSRHCLQKENVENAGSYKVLKSCKLEKRGRSRVELPRQRNCCSIVPGWEDFTTRPADAPKRRGLSFLAALRNVCFCMRVKWHRPLPHTDDLTLQQVICPVFFHHVYVLLRC